MWAFSICLTMLLHQQRVWPWASELTSLYLSFLNYRVEMIMVLPLVFVRIHEFIHIKDWEMLNKQTFPFLPINSSTHEFIHINDSGMLNKLIFSFLPVSSFTQQIFIEYLLSVIHYLVVNKRDKNCPWFHGLYFLVGEGAEEQKTR